MIGISNTADARVLIFAPSAGLWPSYRMQLSLAQAWESLGASVTIVGCDGSLHSLCPVMIASHVHARSSRRERQSYCTECIGVRNVASQESPARFVTIDSVLDQDLRVKVESIMKSLTRDTWQHLELEGIPFGRYATYLTMLTHKTQDVAQTDDSWEDYRADLENSLLTYLACRALVSRTKPTHALVYDRLYPANRAFIVGMRQHGILVAGVTASGFVPRRYSTAVFHPFPHSSQTAVDSTRIASSLDLPLSAEEAKDVEAHLERLVVGNDPWVYTAPASQRSPAEIREQMGLRPDVPVATVLVGSPDETRSSLLVDAEYDRSSGRGFSSIPEFIRTCLAAAKQSPDVDVVIRLHPRLAANRRERVTSPDLAEIQSILRECPKNVVVNAPGDGVGLHDVMKVSSLGVNHASTTGLEFLAVGIPVVHVNPERLNAYPPSLGDIVERGDDQGLARRLRELSTIDSGLVSPIPAWRWLATTLLRVPVHFTAIGQSAPSKRQDDEPLSGHTGQWKLRRVLPKSVRKQAARLMAQRSLKGEVREAVQALRNEELAWAEESWSRFVEACSMSREASVSDEATHDVWEPVVTLRGDTARGVEEETVAVRSGVRRLLTRLGPTGGSGAGVLVDWAE